MASVSGVLKIRGIFYLVGFFFFIFLPAFSFSQSVKELVISKSGITTILKQYPDSIVEDVLRNTMLFPFEDSSKTFWYKIFLNTDCRISFDIYPTGLGNIYNYELYLGEGDILPEDVIVPVRKNFYKDAMYITGIGLTKSSTSGSAGATKPDSIKNIFHTAYHDAFEAKRGSMLLLKITHVKGTDCGHHLTLNANNSSQKFQSIYGSCFSDRAKISQLRYYSYKADQDLEVPVEDSIMIAAKKELKKRSQSILSDTTKYKTALVRTDIVPVLFPSVSLISSVKSNSFSTQTSNLLSNPNSVSQNTVEKKEKGNPGQVKTDKLSAANLPLEYEPNALFIIKDSLRKTTIEADIKVVKPKGAGVKIMVSRKGNYELILENKTNYHFVFSSIGYKSRDIFINSGDSVEAFESEIYLAPCREGENFVMDNIYFYPNTYDMKQEGRSELEKLAQFLKNNPKVCIEIQGHTSGNRRIRSSYSGTFRGSSKKLSQYRADFIKKYLIDKGIAAQRLKAAGYGGKKMIYPKPRNQAQANKNIRVEILFIGVDRTLQAPNARK